MVDNFKLIENLLDFSEKNTFYFVQILKRRKENPEMKTGVSVIDNLYIYDLADMNKLKEKIVERCTKNRARAYINLNRLDTEKIAMYTVKQMMDYIILGDYKAVKNAYATACGSHHSEKSKRWVIDIDAEFLDKKDKLRSIIEELHQEIANNKYKILAEIPTRSGVHIITNPFNMEKFRNMLPVAFPEGGHVLGIDVQKNSPSVLFIPDL